MDASGNTGRANKSSNFELTEPDAAFTAVDIQAIGTVTAEKRQREEPGIIEDLALALALPGHSPVRPVKLVRARTPSEIRDLRNQIQGARQAMGSDPSVARMHFLGVLRGELADAEKDYRENFQTGSFS